MDHREARRILGLQGHPSPGAIRAAHRRRIRETHPDAGGTAHDAARVNEALDTLRRPEPNTGAPPDGVAEPVRTEGDPAAGPARRGTPGLSDDHDHRVFLADHTMPGQAVAGRPSDLLGRLAEAGHTVGEVVFVDPHVGLLEIVVGRAPGVGQLAVTVGETTAAGTPVSFTLEPLGITPAPPITEVVTALMAALSD